MRNYNTHYTYKQINSSSIYSDPEYQRVVDFARVKNIVSNFNPSLVNPIKVSSRNNKYYVFDGQHTLAALKMRNGNKDLAVECKVYTGLTQQDEAILFSEQNGISRSVKINAKMKALYAAGDKEIIEMHDLIASQGIKFDFSECKGRNKIIACSTIYKIFKKTTCSEFCDILSIIKDSWNGDPESFNKEILSGVYVFYINFKSQIDKKKAISQFSKISPQAIIREGKLFKDGGDKRFAKQLVIAYNKKLRGNRLAEEF